MYRSSLNIINNLNLVPKKMLVTFNIGRSTKRKKSFLHSIAICVISGFILYNTGCDRSKDRSPLLSKIEKSLNSTPKHLVPSPALTSEKKRKRSKKQGRIIDFVVMVSVDGMGTRFFKEMVEKGELPTFRRLQETSVWTYEARTDFFNTTTIPNHTCMLTGLPTAHVKGTPKESFHGFTINVDPEEGETLHNHGNPARKYIPSIYDVCHDYGLKTCLYSGKSKFSLFSTSYDDKHGAQDRLGKDNGRGKIDLTVIISNTKELVDRYIKEQNTAPCNLTLLHLGDPDLVGHKSGWGSTEWQEAMHFIDGQLEAVISQIESSDVLHQRTALLLTADHGGIGNNHHLTDRWENYTVPFFIWPFALSKTRDLYHMFGRYIRKPGKENPDYSTYPPPIRNCDIGNLALQLLDLPPIPGSIIHIGPIK